MKQIISLTIYQFLCFEEKLIWLKKKFIWSKDILFESNKFCFIKTKHFFKSKKVVQTNHFLWFNQIFFLSVYICVSFLVSEIIQQVRSWMASFWSNFSNFGFAPQTQVSIYIFFYCSTMWLQSKPEIHIYVSFLVSEIIKQIRP